jgi:hypothetical protein
VPENASREACEAYREQLDAALNYIMYQVDHFFEVPEIVDPRQIDVPDPVPLPK